MITLKIASRAIRLFTQRQIYILQRPGRLRLQIRDTNETGTLIDVDRLTNAMKNSRRQLLRDIPLPSIQSHRESVQQVTSHSRKAAGVQSINSFAASKPL
jgi:hypothetical protein